MPRGKKAAPAAGFYSPNAEEQKAGLNQPVPASAASQVARAPKAQAAKPPPRPDALPAFEEAIDFDEHTGADASIAVIANSDDHAALGETDLAAEIARIRGMDRPFGSLTQKLDLRPIPGYYTHWFNDDPGRVEEQFARGWTSRLDEKRRPIKRIVGRGRDGKGLYAYALKIPEVFRKEEMDRRHAEATARINEIKKNPFRSKPGAADKSDAGKFYSAQDEPLTVEVGRGP